MNALPGNQTDSLEMTLEWMQQTQPWTAPYSREFEHSKRGSWPGMHPEQHRPLMHDLIERVERVNSVRWVQR